MPSYIIFRHVLTISDALAAAYTHNRMGSWRCFARFRFISQTLGWGSPAVNDGIDGVVIGDAN